MAKTMVSKGGAVVRALASHQCGPGSNPGVDAIRGLSLLLVRSLAPRGFLSGYSGFPLSLKTNTCKFQFDLDRTDTFKQRTFQSYVSEQITRLLKKIMRYLFFDF